MTTAITRQAIRRELYNQIPGLGYVGVADSLSGATLTDTYTFSDATVGTNHWRGYYVYRPDLSSDDTIRKITTVNVSTGVITVTGGNYANTAELDYELVGLIHPDEINACITRAQRRIYFETMVPLCGPISDGDMDANNVTSWSDTNAASTKETTASLVYSGIRSLKVTNSGSNGYTTNATALTVKPNQRYYVSTVVKATTGTAQLIVRDNSNTATLNTVTSAESDWVHLYCTGQTPSGCESINIRIGGTGASDVTYWNHLIFQVVERTAFPAPTWLDEQFKFLKLREAVYLRSLNSQSTGGYDAGDSRTFKDWLQPSMYELDPLHLEANPYQIQLNRVAPENELWINGKRPYSDLESLSTESSTTLAPPHLIYAYSKEEIAKVLKKRYPADRRWDILLGEAIMEVDAETRSRPEVPLQPMRREVWTSI